MWRIDLGSSDDVVVVFMINRRSLITGLVSFVAAPAIVRASSLMPVKAMEPVRIWKPSDYSVAEKIELNVLYGKMRWISYEEAIERWPLNDYTRTTSRTY